jgi:hypothetical protein
LKKKISFDRELISKRFENLKSEIKISYFLRKRKMESGSFKPSPWMICCFFIVITAVEEGRDLTFIVRLFA